jgi:hypothetical protein
MASWGGVPNALRSFLSKLATQADKKASSRSWADPKPIDNNLARRSVTVTPSNLAASSSWFCNPCLVDLWWDAHLNS